MKARFLIVLMAIALFFDSNAQNQAPNFTLSSPLSGNQVYEATQYIDMINGFNYKATNVKDVFHAKINPFLVFPPEEGEFGGPDPNDNGVVGTIGGSYDVSSTGAATYDLPLDLPTGINGLQPQLSVSYNSQAGNGIMGIGWNLNGLSAITRAGSNLFNDQVIKGVNFSDDDHFSLDGNRLMNIAGVYGQNGTEYRTELETFSKIVSFRSSGTAPDYFIVWTKSGQIIEYGRTQDSRIELPYLSGTQILVGTWLVNKISDRFGNTIDFTYTENNTTGEYKLDNIKYGGNLDKGIPMKCEVKFKYRSDRKDKIFKYVAPGRINSLTNLLEKIEILTNNKIQYSYEIGYKLDATNQLDFASKLVSLKRIQSDGVSLNPVEFEYNDNAPLATERVLNEITYCYEHNNKYYVYDGNKSVMADFNGDGKVDILIVYRFWNSNENKVSNYKLFYAGADHYEYASEGSLPNNEFMYFLPCSLNGDQAIDLLMFEWVDTDNPWTEPEEKEIDITAYIAIENGFDLMPKYRIAVHPDMVKFLIDDFNGDAKSELLAMIFPFPDFDIAMLQPYSFEFSPTFNVVQHQPRPSNASINHYYETRDMDADGIPELVRLKSDGMYVYKFLFEVGGQTISEPVHYSFPSSGEQVYWADFNADGYTDILFRNKSTGVWGIRLFTGSDYVAINCPITLTEDPSNNRVMYSLMDYNGDGLVDIYEKYLEIENPKTFRNTFYYNNGNSFRSESFYTYDIDHDIRINPIEKVTDLNGDGINDVIYQANNDYNPGLVYLVAYEINSKDKSNLIKVIRDEFDNETTFTYKHLPYCYGDETTPPEYVKYSNSTYPFSDFQGPIAVVTELSSYDGLGSMIENKREIKYRYEGAKLHLRGKGFQGFMKRTVSDIDAGSWSETVSIIEATENYIFPHVDLTQSFIKINDIDKKLNETKYLYYINNDQLQNMGKRFTPLLIRTHSKNWNEKGNDNYEKTLRTEFYYNGDNNALTYGNPYKIVELGHENEIGFNATNENFRFGKESINSFYYENEWISNWIIAAVKDVQIRNFMNGQDDIIINQHYDYYPYGNPNFPLLMSSRLHPDSEMEIKTDYSYDDQFLGLLKITTVSAPNFHNPQTILPRSEKFEYKSEYGYRFLTKKYNAFKDATETVCDPTKGVILQTIDANQFITHYYYDSFNRLTKQTNHDGIENVSVKRWAPGHEDFRSGSIWYSWSCVSGHKPILVFFDKLGREIRNVSYSPSGQKVYIDKDYDHLGRMVRESEPHLPNVTDFQKTIFAYDELDRPTLILEPGDISTSFSYGKRSISVTNEHNKTSTKTTDAADRIVSSTDADNKNVTYNYYSNGLLKTTTINGDLNTRITFTYDINGKTTSTIDPSWGESTYQYNPYGELIFSEDARHKKYSLSYDVLGRLRKRTNLTDLTDITNWEYETTPGKLGLLKKESNNEGHAISFTYDTYNRIEKRTETIQTNGISYDVFFTYDELGRTKSLTYPDDELTLYYEYDKENGVLKSIRRSYDNAFVWEALTYNKDGQLTSSKRGDNHIMTREYFPETGLLSSTSCEGVQAFQYIYDKLGNLKDRYDHLHKVNNQSLHEYFEYDNRNQLTYIYRSGVAPIQMVYDDLGNITNKVDVGLLSYGIPLKPYQLGTITPNNNLSSSYITPQVISYTDFNKVEIITSNGYEIEIDYGLNQQRISQKLYTGTGMEREFVKEKQFLAGLVEKTIFADNTTETINYITSPEGLTAIEVVTDSGSREWYWVFTDHLGSITTLLRESDGQKFEMSFDAWGNRRDPSTWNNYTTTLPDFIIDRGYTGHEHLDVFGLINMNGRVYDPLAARFLSPDSYIQAPGLPQNYNGYIYCLNNPLRYTDPSGNVFLFALPYGSWSPKGGFDIGVTAGVGFSKIASAQITIGYSSKSNTGYITAGASIAGFTGYIGYSSSGGLIAGVSVGLGAFGIDNKSPINSNAFTAGISFSSRGGVSVNAFGFTYSRYGLGFDLSIGFSSPFGTNLIKLPNGSLVFYTGDMTASTTGGGWPEFPPGIWITGCEVISTKDYSIVVRALNIPYGYSAADGGGGLGTASTIIGAVGVTGDVTSMSTSTFRLMSGANGSFSPKIYNSGWNGGSRARITTYSLSKAGTAVSTGASVVTTYMSYNQIYNGQAQPITYVDAGVGTAGILAGGASYFYGVQIPFVGEFVAFYGAVRLTWDVSFYLGTQYGPSKWYGTNDNKWFK